MAWYFVINSCDEVLFQERALYSLEKKIFVRAIGEKSKIFFYFFLCSVYISVQCKSWQNPRSQRTFQWTTQNWLVAARGVYGHFSNRQPHLWRTYTNANPAPNVRFQQVKTKKLGWPSSPQPQRLPLSIVNPPIFSHRWKRITPMPQIV